MRESSSEAGQNAQEYSAENYRDLSTKVYRLINECSAINIGNQLGGGRSQAGITRRVNKADKIYKGILGPPDPDKFKQLLLLKQDLDKLKAEHQSALDKLSILKNEDLLNFRSGTSNV